MNHEARIWSLIERVSFRNPVLPMEFRLGGDHPKLPQSIKWLQVVADIPDNCDTNAPRRTQRGRKWRLSPNMTDFEVVSTAWAAVQMFVQHELREQFLVDGVAIFDGHYTLDDMVRNAREGAGKDARAPMPGWRKFHEGIPADAPQSYLLRDAVSRDTMFGADFAALEQRVAADFAGSRAEGMEPADPRHEAEGGERSAVEGTWPLGYSGGTFGRPRKSVPNAARAEDRRALTQTATAHAGKWPVGKWEGMSRG